MSQGYATQLAIGATGTAVGSFTSRLEFNSFNVVEETTLIESAGIRGTRSRPKERIAQGLKNNTGSFTLNPSPAELDLLLPWILGAVESTDTFALADALTARALLVDYGPNRAVYDNAYVNRATFRSSPGQVLELEIDVIAKDATFSATAFPSIAVDTDNVFVHHQGVLTLISAAREFTTVEVTVDNLLSAIFNNSQEATDIDPQDRLVTLSCDVPYKSANTTLLTTDSGSAAGAAGTLVYTNGGQSITFTFANLKSIARSPTIGGKTEIRLPLNYQAYKSDSTDELVITHDSAA